MPSLEVVRLSANQEADAPAVASGPAVTSASAGLPPFWFWACCWPFAPFFLRRLRRRERPWSFGCGRFSARAAATSATVPRLSRAESMRRVARGGEPSQQDPHALRAVLLPGRRLCYEGDEVIEARAVDAHGDPVGERGHPQASVRVLSRAGEQELLQAAPAGMAVGQLLHEVDALLEPDLAACDLGPEALLVLVQIAWIDPLPLPPDHAEPALDVGRH